MIETSLSDGVNCTHGSCVANLLYRFESIILNSVYSTQCRVVTLHSERLIQTSLSGRVKCTHGCCLANVLYKFELIVINGVYSTWCRILINGVYSTQYRAVNIQSEKTDCGITE